MSRIRTERERQLADIKARVLAGYSLAQLSSEIEEFLMPSREEMAGFLSVDNDPCRTESTRLQSDAI